MALHLSVNPHTKKFGEGVNPLKDKFLVSLSFFLILNISLYLFILFFHSRVPFNKINYVYNAHHFFEDPRIRKEKFNLINSLGQFDAQWYLKIASEGYPKNPKNIPIDKYKGAPDVLTYAFFPLYPTILSITNRAFDTIELIAFTVANILMILNFGSLYYVVEKLFNEKTATKTCFLLFLFPFSIFFRSFFSEGLFLFLLIWFSYFLIKKNFLPSSLFLGLITVTRPNGLFLLLPFFYFLIKAAREKRVSVYRSLLCLVLVMSPLFVWFYYNFLQTGDFLYFYRVQSFWYEKQSFFSPLINNINNLISFNSLPLHFFHKSKIDILTALAGIALLIVSRKKLTTELWLISLSLIVFPLLTKDTMSYSRYQSVVFPLFLYLAIVLKKGVYGLVAGLFLITLFITSLYFINWFWVG